MTPLQLLMKQIWFKYSTADTPNKMDNVHITLRHVHLTTVAMENHYVMPILSVSLWP